MVIHRNEMLVENKERLRDGEGIARMTHFVDGSKQKNARLIAEISLEPGASIGHHQHDSETEYYIILDGTGIVNDNGNEVEVKQGDAIVTGDGASHSIKNTGTVPLVFHAVIVTY
jgi:mannose-6-phosphate isomerase-like protein (cupin superfamily)